MKETIAIKLYAAEMVQQYMNTYNNITPSIPINGNILKWVGLVVVGATIYTIYQMFTDSDDAREQLAQNGAATAKLGLEYHEVALDTTKILAEKTDEVSVIATSSASIAGNTLGDVTKVSFDSMKEVIENQGQMIARHTEEIGMLRKMVLVLKEYIKQPYLGDD